MGNGERVIEGPRSPYAIHKAREATVIGGCLRIRSDVPCAKPLPATEEARDESRSVGVNGLVVNERMDAVGAVAYPRTGSIMYEALVSLTFVPLRLRYA